MGEINHLEPRTPNENTIIEYVHPTSNAYFEKMVNEAQLVYCDSSVCDTREESLRLVRNAAHRILRNTHIERVLDADGDLIVSIEKSDKWSDITSFATKDEIQEMSGAINHE